MGIPWPNVMSISFLVFFSVLLWGTWQGFFSTRIKRSLIPERIDAGDPCIALRDENTRLKARVFELENELAAKTAHVDELNKKIQELLNIINAVTLDLDTCRTRNAELSSALKAALEDLTACRAQLGQCKSELLAKQIKDSVCKMQPENANLLR
jgi:chromosome segregation ATPase